MLYRSLKILIFKYGQIQIESSTICRKFFIKIIDLKEQKYAIVYTNLYVLSNKMAFQKIHSG